MSPGGRIYTPTQLDNLPKAERDECIEVPDDQIEDVTKMNRKDRRTWYAKHRKKKNQK